MPRKPIKRKVAMNDAQRKRLRELKDRALRREAEKQGANPPANRVSIFGTAFLGSDKSEWTHIDTIGWYHISELLLFQSRYVRSVSGQYIPSKDALAIYESDNYIARSELDALGYVICVQSGRACPKADSREAIDRRGRNITIHARYVDARHYMTCDVLQKLATADGMLHIRGARRYHHVSHYAYTVAHPEYFARCPRCENTVERETIVDRGGGVVSCDYCYRREVLVNVIRRYDDKHYPPAIVSKRTVRRVKGDKFVTIEDPEMRLYGVEIEVEIKDRCKLDRWTLAQNAAKAAGEDYLVFKDDGSLRNHPKDSPLWGFEMVTAPADLDTHRERLPRLETMAGFHDLRAWDTVTCGLHIHVDRSALTTLQVGRALVFINHKKNLKFIEHVAGRSGGGDRGYNRFIDKNYGDGMRPDPEKYVALNTRPPKTIEFRIFRGTVRARHIIRNLEFCDAVCNFCHPGSRSLQEMHDYHNFLNYVGQNRKRYPMLVEWFVNQKYLPALRQKPGTELPEVVEAEIVEKGVQSRQ